MTRTIEEMRADIGAIYCHVCKKHTLPDERTGECFFCQTQLLAVKGRKDAA